MPIRITGLLCGGLLALSAPAALAAGPTSTHIRVEGQNRTLVPERTVTLSTGTFTKDGDPSHSCPVQSAGGALQQATGGDWAGSYSEGLGYFVSAIKGETHGGSPDFWSLWINNRMSQTGMCSLAVKPSDRVLFFVDRCEYDAAKQACSNTPVTPLGLRAPRAARRGRSITLRVVSYTAAGKARAVRGARVYANGRRLPRTTDSRGRLRVRGTRPGRVVFYATHPGNVRSEAVTTRVRK